VNSGYEEKSLGNVSALMKWHRRLGHWSVGYLQEIKKTMSELKEAQFDTEEITYCDTCKQA